MKNKNTKIETIVIIGGGPAGLASAIYSARGNLNPLVFAGFPPGGQMTLTSDVENYPGIESIAGSELIERMRKHAKKFGARIIDNNVLKVDFSGKPFKVYTADDQKNYTKTESVIIATGAKALWLGLKSETRLRGKGVSACATCDGFFFKNKIVAVVGGGDVAMEEALILSNFASKVYLIHRRDSFRASKIMQERVFANPKIEILWKTKVTEVLGQDKVEGVKLDNNSSIKLNGLFIAIGHNPDTNIFKNHIEMDAKGYIITSNRFAAEFARLQVQNHNIQLKVRLENKKIEEIKQKFDLNYNYITSVPGIFAAGDCVDFQYAQASTAVGTGVAAALEVERWLK